MSFSKRLRALVLLSGNGSTFQNLYERSQDGSCALEICGVLASRSSAFGLTRAQGFDLPVHAVERKNFADVRAFSQEVFNKVNVLKPDLLLMAGFNCLLLLPERFIGKTLNIHPSLLPDFGGKGMYGLRVHQAVIKAKAKETGCTLHYVDNQYDHGPVIAQKKLEVLADDTPESLQVRVQEAERQLYPEGINMVAKGSVRYEAGKALFL